MQLLIIRHGTAEETAPNGDDAQRSLTEAGKREVKDAVKGLKTLVENIDTIGASPLLRARQTAEIVAKGYGDPPIQIVPALIPGNDPASVLAWLEQNTSAKVIALVGHEPLLGVLVTWFMTGSPKSRVALTKSGAALLEFSARVGVGAGTLQWVVTGSTLRDLRRSRS
jgi:phosphohistidine phosphatase